MIAITMLCKNIMEIILCLCTQIQVNYHYYNIIIMIFFNIICIILDSLAYFIQTDDFYKYLMNNTNLLDRMDTSNLPRSHPCYIADRKKIPLLFSMKWIGRLWSSSVRCEPSHMPTFFKTKRKSRLKESFAMSIWRYNLECKDK